MLKKKKEANDLKQVENSLNDSECEDEKLLPSLHVFIIA